MTVLHHLAQAAAVILLVDLLVVLFIFLGIAGGLAFGLHWVRGKTSPTFERVNGYLPLVSKYALRATDLVAKPFIAGTALAERVKATAQSIRRRVREQHPPSAAMTSTDSDLEMTTVVPAVSEDTVSTPVVSEVQPRA
ncbi:MAG TPA: hypothetical protein VF221_18560 [Chloroflexota bacterium]